MYTHFFSKKNNNKQKHPTKELDIKHSQVEGKIGHLSLLEPSFVGQLQATGWK